MIMIGSLYKDLYPEPAKSDEGIFAVTGDGTIVGSILDMHGKDRVLVAGISGTITDGTHTVKIEHGDDSGLSDAADVVASDLNGSLPAFLAADDNKVKTVEVILRKRYLRVSLVSTGVTTGGSIALGVLERTLKSTIQT